MHTLPHCNEALVPIEITGYLLNPEHREGRSKAIFFSKFGFALRNSNEFEQALEQLACDSWIVQVEQRPPFGTRVTTEGNLRTPDGRNPMVRVGWFYEGDIYNHAPR